MKRKTDKIYTYEKSRKKNDKVEERQNIDKRRENKAPREIKKKQIRQTQERVI